MIVFCSGTTGKEKKKETIRMGKDERIAKQAGIRLNVKVLNFDWCCHIYALRTLVEIIIPAGHCDPSHGRVQ